MYGMNYLNQGAISQRLLNNAEKLTGIVRCHVDDLHAGELEFQDLLCNLKQRLLVNKWKRTMSST